MDPKQQALQNLQRERQQRGSSFQEEIRRSWRLVPDTWRMNIKDGGGSTRPSDEITLARKVNILTEMKRTKKKAFELNMLRSNQVIGLYDFDIVHPHHYGLVFISFLDENVGVDEAYAFRFVTAAKYFKEKHIKHIPIELFRTNQFPCIPLPVIHGKEREYDLKEVVHCYKYL